MSNKEFFGFNDRGPQFLTLELLTDSTRSRLTYYTKPHENDEGFDRIEVHQIPRWKESELSGDEYRWTNVAVAMRKGDEVASTVGVTMFDALVNLLPVLKRISGWGFLGLDECAQPGCPNEPDVLLRILTPYDKSGRYRSASTNKVRPFCKEHLHRGDCGMEDNDDNYERLALRLDGKWIPYPGRAVRE